MLNKTTTKKRKRSHHFAFGLSDEGVLVHNVQHLSFSLLSHETDGGRIGVQVDGQD